MKTFIENHEAVIQFWNAPTVNAKDGEIIPHKPTVSKIYFYHEHVSNREIKFLKIELTKEMILDLADSIKTIESQIIEMPFDSMPF